MISNHVKTSLSKHQKLALLDWSPVFSLVSWESISIHFFSRSIFLKNYIKLINRSVPEYRSKSLLHHQIEFYALSSTSFLWVMSCIKAADTNCIQLGSVIQVTGTVEFDDGLWIVNHLKSWNGLQRVCIIPGILPVCLSKFLRGQTEFQSA